METQTGEASGEGPSETAPVSSAAVSVQHPSSADAISSSATCSSGAGFASSCADVLVSVGPVLTEEGAIGSSSGGGISQQNAFLRRILLLMEPLLDVEGMLLMRQTCRLAWKHQYRPADGVLCFAMFRGVDARVLMEQVVPLACQAVHPALREEGLSLDFSGCTLLRDASVARLMNLVHSGKDDNSIRGTLRRLKLDYCYELTNKGLAAMLTTYLPSLESLSLRCARSNELTFSNVAADFSPDNWPRLTHIDASFTNMRLEAATLLADALVVNATNFNKRHRREYETKIREEKQLRALLTEQEKEWEQHSLQALQLRQDAEAVRGRLAEQLQLLAQKEAAMDSRRQEAALGEEDPAPRTRPLDTVSERRQAEEEESHSLIAAVCSTEATEKKLTREESAVEDLRAAEAALAKQKELVVRLELQLDSLLTAIQAAEEAASACRTASDHSKTAAEAAAVAAGESLALAELAEKTPIAPSFEMLGSLASMCLLAKVGMEAHCRSFSHMVKLGEHEKISSLTKVVQKEFGELCASSPYRGSSLLSMQTKRGSELLVNAPITVETCEDGGVNVLTLPVSIAIQTQDQETLRVLIKRGAQIDVCDYLGKSPLLRACEASRLDFVETLLDLGASPNPHDLRSPHCPLQTAIRRGDVEIVKRLLSRGACLDVKCPAVRSYKSALCVACEINNPAIIQLLLEAGGDPNARGQNAYTPTLMAYQLSPHWLPLFLKAGAGTPKSKRSVLTDVLSCAVGKNDLPSVQLLIEKHPDLMNRTHPLWSKPLLQAAKQGKAQVVEMLIAQGCNVDARGEGGQTALLAATEEGLGVCVERLVRHGADVNKANYEGLTPLIVACMENHEEMVDFFLNNTQTPYSVKVHPHALQQPHLLPLEASALSKADQQILAETAGEAEGPWVYAKQTLVLDCNKTEKTEGETALLVCIRLRNDRIAKKILTKAKQLDLEAKDSQGRTALLSALLFGQYAVASLLMEMGASVFAQDAAGNTALAIANERLLTPGSDKRVLRKFLRLYRASRDGSRRQQAGAGVLHSMLSALRDENGSSSHVESDSGSGAESGAGLLFRRKSASRSSSRGKNSSGPESSGDGLFACSSSRAGSGSGPPLGGGGGGSRSDGEVTRRTDGASGRGKRSGKKLKLEPRTVLQVAKLPISLFRAAKAK